MAKKSTAQQPKKPMVKPAPVVNPAATPTQMQDTRAMHKATVATEEARNRAYYAHLKSGRPGK